MKALLLTVAVFSLLVLAAVDFATSSHAFSGSAGSYKVTEIACKTNRDCPELPFQERECKDNLAYQWNQYASCSSSLGNKCVYPAYRVQKCLAGCSAGVCIGAPPANGKTSIDLTPEAALSGEKVVIKVTDSGVPADKTAVSVIAGQDLIQLSRFSPDSFLGTFTVAPTSCRTTAPTATTLPGPISTGPPSIITPPVKKYCGNLVVEPELGEKCDPAGINLEQCPTPQYSGTCNQCKQCDPAPSSEITVSASIDPNTGKLSVTVKDWLANTGPKSYETIKLRLSYTVAEQNNPDKLCQPKLVLYKEATGLRESGVNTGEWKHTESWSSSDAFVEYVRSDGKIYTATAGKYLPPSGCCKKADSSWSVGEGDTEGNCKVQAASGNKFLFSSGLKKLSFQSCPSPNQAIYADGDIAVGYTASDGNTAVKLLGVNRQQPAKTPEPTAAGIDPILKASLEGLQKKIIERRNAVIPSNFDNPGEAVAYQEGYSIQSLLEVYLDAIRDLTEFSGPHPNFRLVTSPNQEHPTNLLGSLMTGNTKTDLETLHREAGKLAWLEIKPEILPSVKSGVSTGLKATASEAYLDALSKEPSYSSSKSAGAFISRGTFCKQEKIGQACSPETVYRVDVSRPVYGLDIGNRKLPSYIRKGVVHLGFGTPENCMVHENTYSQDCKGLEGGYISIHHSASKAEAFESKKEIKNIKLEEIKEKAEDNAPIMAEISGTVFTTKDYLTLASYEKIEDIPSGINSVSAFFPVTDARFFFQLYPEPVLNSRILKFVSSNYKTVSMKENVCKATVFSQDTTEEKQKQADVRFEAKLLRKEFDRFAEVEGSSVSGNCEAQPGSENKVFSCTAVFQYNKAVQDTACEIRIRSSNLLAIQTIGGK